ncbi:NAD-dependent epimerase/dehydratase family protein [Empedobacter falsenii]|uniref:NAD-dependent epimerase/dehydratase family protein n=1 Tax=Empedobacter falsenii TaxID=343874 RepID=A0A3R8SUM8_9FLAO|nr:NAD-dependent epimerase/dehydratase family protein [Empedobacter falsenii]RRT93455.1 NAD-dependent epimerase/dehydratase family protein [Empedobacter falsenii]RRT93601.1 NAD-dependent epimerase/dehydratase family protein [Empedobacter falsenii]
MKTVFITGVAGFIGYHLAEKLIVKNIKVVGIDNINDYYTVQLKYDRLKELGINQEFASNFGQKVLSSKHEEKMIFYRMNLEDKESLAQLFKTYSFDAVVNMAAQAGVRYSIENPDAYGQSNLVGFLNILECCRNYNVKKLLYASSSSIYGNSSDVPFSTNQNVDHPISLYAATKKANELMAHAYSHLYNFQTIGLRFFTVYGPWGRPDMAMFLFTDAILNHQPLKVFNHGDLSRDFTYIDDIIQGIDKILEDKNTNEKYQLYNIGNSKPVQLMDFIKEVELSTGEKAILEMYPMQAGDVNQTWADVQELKDKFGYNPHYPVDKGVYNFVQWYRKYYNK